MFYLESKKQTIASKILESNGLTKETFDDLFNDPEKWPNLILKEN
jgi:autonomous glycyl radical cofactor GrcA